MISENQGLELFSMFMKGIILFVFLKGLFAFFRFDPTFFYFAWVGSVSAAYFCEFD